MDAPALVDAYLAHCQARRLAPATIRRYQDALRPFRRPGPLPDAGEIEADLAKLAGLSDWTARTAWQAWATFFRWAARRYGIQDPTSQLRPPRVRPAERRLFTPDELRRLWDAARSPRDKALVLTALDTGARLGELAGLRKADIGGDVLTLNSSMGDMPGCRHCALERAARAPGGKSGPRRVPVLPSTAALLRSLGDAWHIWTAEPEGKPARNRAVLDLAAEGLGATAITRRLLELRYGRISETMVRDILRRRPSLKPGRAMTTEGVREAFKRLFDRAGLDGPKVGPHSLRHSFATQYLVNGGSLPFLQRLLGHRDPKTTAIYTHLAIQDLRRVHARMTPALALGDLRSLTRPRRPQDAWNGVKSFVLNRDGRSCAACGAAEDLTLDHVFPRSRGGRNSPGNGQILCRRCNEAKADTVAV